MKPYVYAVFLRLPCESILPPRQCFHLVDKRITAREFNTHVRPALTVRTYYSDDDIRITGTVHCPPCTCTKLSIFWPQETLLINYFEPKVLIGSVNIYTQTSI